ncbi:hypothetical protein ABFA07_017667 [Porites harrisoni]
MSPLFFVIFFLAAVGYANGGACGTVGDGTCYYIDDPCPQGMEDCSDTYDCDLDTNKCCCPAKPRDPCGSGNIQDTCYYIGDDCPSGRVDCAAEYSCPLDTNKCCCVQ